MAAERSLRIRRGLIGLALALAALAAVPAAAAAGAAPGHRADSSLADWRGKPANIAGHLQISRGELIYTDYLYDDYGADVDGTTNAPPFRSTPRTSGDYRYPADPRFADNAADIRELRLAIDGKGLHGMLALQTMVKRDAAVATVALDLDGKQSTGAGTWPAGAGVTTPGADAFVTLSGKGATLTDAKGRKTSIPESVNTRQNAIEFDVPAAKLGRIAAGARVWAAAGLDDGSGGYAPQTGAAPFDLAFQGDETYGGGSQWGDRRQSAALASGDLAAFSAALEPKLLEQGKSRSLKLAPGYYNRIFRSSRSYGEGIDTRSGGTFGTGSPIFLGRYQPYGLYLPRGYDPKRASQLLLELHSLNQNQNQYAAVDPNLLKELGDDRNSVIITPLNRATDGWYLDAGLIDVLEAWDDVASAYDVDRNRTDIMGYSMGGYGTYRLGLLMPDRFARAVTFVGPPAFFYWNPPTPPISAEPEWTVPGFTNQIVANGLNLPFEINAGGADTLVAIAGVRRQAETFRELGNEYRFYEHPAASHFTFAIDDVWDHSAAWLGDARRVKNPSRVRYVRYPSMDLPDAGLVFDGAYWVDGMKVRRDTADDSHGSIDVTSDALGGRKRNLVDEGTTDVPAGGSGSTAATVTGQHVVPGARLKVRNGFRLEASNLAAVELDARRMGLDTRRPIAGTLHGDGKLRLRLARWKGPAPKASLDGKSVRAKKSKGTVTIKLGLGSGVPGELRLR